MKNKYFLIIPFFSLLIACNSDNKNTDTQKDTEKERVAKLPRQKVSVNTQYGEMIIELFNETPKHRDNFLKLAKEGFYDSLLFHRVQPNFMIQGGDPDTRGSVEPSQLLGMGGADKRIESEITSKFIMRQGAICGYHQGTGLFPDKSSNSSQFMIIHGNPLKAIQLREASIKNMMDYTPQQIHLYEMYGGSPQLDGKHTVFGQIVEGMHILNKIVAVKTYRSINPQLPDRPVEDIRMVVKVIEE